jgi:hypothetical protein
MRNFRPTTIILSYSGKIKIDDAHMVELTQELTKISNYKLLFFTNFTAAHCKEKMFREQEEMDEERGYYDKVVTNIGDGILDEIKSNMQTECQ